MAAPLRQKYGVFLHIFTSNSSLSSHAPITAIDNVCRHCIKYRGLITRSINARTIYQQDENHHNKVGYRGSVHKGDNFWKQNIRNFCFGSPLLDDQVHLKTTFDFNRKSQNNNAVINICQRTFCSESPEKKRDKDDLQTQNKAENIYTVPNLLTLSRVMLTPVIGVLVVQQSFPAALALFTFAGVTDWLDGYIARNYKGQMSTFGTAMDPLADKILVSVLTVTLTMAHLLPVPLAVVILGRDFLLVIAGFVIRYLSLPPPFTLRRYFDGTIPTVKLSPSTLSKVNTGLQLSLVCLTLAAPVFGFVDHPVLQCLWCVTAATTLGSGIDYVLNRNKYMKFLKHR